MANNNFMKTTLSLTSPICMDINDNVVRPFDSFNKKNAPFIGDQLSPFYVEEDTDCSNCVFTRNGDKYQIKTRKLYKNGVLIPNNELGWGLYKRKNNYQVIFEGKGDRHSLDWRDTQVRRQVAYSEEGETQYRYYLHESNPTWEAESSERFSEINAYCVISDEDFYIEQGSYKETWLYILVADFKKNNISLLKARKIKRDAPMWMQIDKIGDIPFTFPTNTDITNPYITFQKLPNGMYAISLMSTSGTRINKALKPFNFIVSDFDTLKIITDIRIGDSSKYYTFPFYFDDAVQDVTGAPIKPAIYYVGKYNDIKGSSAVANEDVYYFGHAIIENVSITESTAYLSMLWEKWFSDNTIKNNAKDIRKKVAVSYTLYPNYYHQCGCIKRSDIFIPWNFHKAYNLGPRDNLFNGVNLTTTEINEDTIVYSDLPDVIEYRCEVRKPTSTGSYLEDGYYYININNGYQSGVCSQYGNLIAPWYSYNKDVYIGGNNALVRLHNEDGTEIEINPSSWTPQIKALYNDRYILIASDSKYNAYDTKTDKWFNWSSGYNGNIEVLTYWFGSSKRPSQSELETAGKKANNLFLIASAENANYEASGNPFISSIFPATRLIGVVKRDTINDQGVDVLPYIITAPIRSFREVDIYKAWGNKSLVPLYETSYRYDSIDTFVKPNLLGLPYPESPNTILSLSLTAKFIQSYNNHDFIIEDDKSYPLIYSNNYPIFAYRALTFIENITNVFVIQNSNYLIFDNKIMSVAYQGDQIVSNAIVADITGMEFIGNTNQVAFFFSKLVKKIYAFTGDTVLREQRGANVIDKIYGTFFIPADNTVVMSCKEYDGKDYVYFFGSDSFLRLENDAVDKCFYANNQIILISGVVYGKANKYSYFKNPNGKKIPIELQTGYFGIGNEMSSVIDCWYIRVFDEDKGSGDVTISQNTLTNIGAKTESKTIHINPGDWDKQTNSYLIRYQPRYQNGVGIQLNLVSDFSIYEIVVSSRQGETQLTSPKAQI